MSTWENLVSVQPEINPPRPTPKLTVATSDEDGALFPALPLLAAAGSSCHAEMGAAGHVEGWIDFEHVLDERLNALRAQLIMAHQRELSGKCVPGPAGFWPLTTLAHGTPPMELPTSGKHHGYGQEHVWAEDGTTSPRHADTWASLCAKLLERHEVSAFGITPLAQEPPLEWVLQRVWATPAGSRPASGPHGHANRHAIKRVSAVVDLEGLLGHEKSGELKEGDLIIDKFVVHPDGFVRYFWAVIGTIILIYDGITIPMECVGLLDEAPPSLAKGIFIFWVVDLLFQFVTGFHSNGVVELRFLKTSRRYLRTWCALDSTILSIDLFFIIANELDSLSAGNSMRFVRSIRVLRLVRMGRLHRIGELINHMSTRIFSEYVAMLVKISQLILLLVAVNHYIACMWYGLGTAGQEETWLADMTIESRPYLYALSLHWSLTQFAPATNNVAPRNFVERLFAIGVVMFALVYFSSFISSVTNSVNQLKMYGQGKRKERARIREFISRKGLSTELGARIQVFFDEQYSKVTRPLQEGDIAFFDNLPETHRIRMHEEVFLPFLLAHQPFEAFSKADLSLLTAICHVAMAEKHYIPQEDVFVKHMMAQKVRIVVKGSLDYIMGVGFTNLVNANTWASEQALYVQWMHSGKFTALTSCEFAEIDCEHFHNLVAHHTMTSFRCFQVFANVFVTFMETAVEEGNVITDVDLAGKDFDGIAERCVAFYYKAGPLSRRSSSLSHLSARASTWLASRSLTNLTSFLPT